MASLEAKILGEDVKDNYCSSSEDEPDAAQPQSAAQSDAPVRGAASRNTGPKGVVEDYRRYKQLQNERNEHKQKELVALAQKLSMTCRTYNDDLLEAEREKAEQYEKQQSKRDEDEDDEFMREYLQKRMAEMRRMAQLAKHVPKYGAVIELVSADDFLHVTEKQEEDNLVLVYIYEPNVPGCKQMDRCFDAIAEQFPSVKCCKVRAVLLHTSAKFRSLGVPALQAYRRSQLVGNFVRLRDEFGDDVGPDDVVGFLQDYGILPEQDAQSTSVNASAIHAHDDSDSDFGVD